MAEAQDLGAGVARQKDVVVGVHPKALEIIHAVTAAVECPHARAVGCRHLGNKQVVRAARAKRRLGAVGVPERVGDGISGEHPEDNDVLVVVGDLNTAAVGHLDGPLQRAVGRRERPDVHVVRAPVVVVGEGDAIDGGLHGIVEHHHELRVVLRQVEVGSRATPEDLCPDEVAARVPLDDERRRHRHAIDDRAVDNSN